MNNTRRTGRFCRTAAVAVVSFVSLTATSQAQQTVINNGGVTVRNPNGTTTRINNGGVVTTQHEHKGHEQKSTVRVVGSNSGSASVSGNNRKVTIQAKNGNVTVSGNHNKVTVKGRCEHLSVSGNNNFVSADNVVDISATGNANTIVWGMSPTRSGSPHVVQTGSRNSVSRRQ